MFASIKLHNVRHLHNLRVARTTEHSDFDRIAHLAVEFPRLDQSERLEVFIFNFLCI